MENHVQTVQMFPALAEHPLLIALVMDMKEVDEKKAHVIKGIENCVLKIQASCEHIFIGEEKECTSYNFCTKDGGFVRSGARVLEAKTCSLCGLTENRPSGTPTEICHFCWSPMKFHQRLPSEDHESIYFCTNPKCFYGSWNT